MKNKRRVVIIPAYEPTFLLCELLVEIRQAHIEAVVVDDGSGPAFSLVFAHASTLATVLTLPKNYGKGFALKVGMEHIARQYSAGCTVITMDADGQHAVNDALSICEEAECYPGALILGSRRLGRSVPLRSRLGNSVTRRIFRLATGLPLQDTQTGLRAFVCSLIPSLLEINGERYEYEMNVLLEFSRQGIPIRESEIATIYFNNNAGSHFATVRDSYRIYKEIAKFSLSSFASFLVDYSVFSLLTVVVERSTAIAAVPVANIAARIISSCVNYTINRTMVFKSTENVGKSATQYFALAAGVLAGNTVVLSLLVNQAGINPFAAKLVTELLFFAISWSVQHFLIFGKKRLRFRESG